MTTITSPDGRTHLIQIHPAVYRGVRMHTMTWCGIRATRGWTTRKSTSSTCMVCERRHDAADGTARPGPGEAAAAQRAAAGEGDETGGDRPPSEGHGGHGGSIWSRPDPGPQTTPDGDVWSRPSPRPSRRPAATGNTVVPDDG